MEYPDNIIPLFPRRPVPRMDGPVFKELAEEYLRTEAAEHVCPGNAARHVRHLAALWDRAEGELRPRVIKQALGELRKRLGAATVNKVRATGRLIIREAILNDRWEGPNPFDVVKRAKEARPLYRETSLEEVRAILAHMREDRRREALFMVYLGPRPGEMKALRKEDVDLKRGLITIRRSNGRDKTKTGKERLVPIPEGLWPWLEDCVRSSPCEYVFPKRGTKEGQRFDVKLARALREPLRKAGLVSGYRYACRRKGCGHHEERPASEVAHCPKCGYRMRVDAIPIKLRYYDLRHAASTLHRRAGADPLAIQIALGHAPETLTDSVYTHLTLDDIRRELNKLEV